VVYALTVVAAAIVATGEVIQQRLAAQAPPEDNLSPRLLLWLVQRPRWLAGVGCSLAGNLAFAAALSRGSVILIEAVFVVRLIFGLTISAFWGWHRIPLRDVVGGLVITIGLVAFILAGRPQAGDQPVPTLHWALGGGSLVAFALVLAVLSRTGGRARTALLLGGGAGALFGLQAALIQSAVQLMTGSGVVALLESWHGYVVVVVALLGMLLVQSAFEAAPLPASYPGVVTTQLLAALAIGVFILGGTVRSGPAHLAVIVPAFAAMPVGISMLTRSPLVTGQAHRDREERRQAEQTDASGERSSP
jgi:drug/metabolite transporter (DMT)-like permease